MAQWHLDMRVTLTLILGLFIHAGSSIWWAAQIDAAITEHSTRIERNATDITGLRAQGGEIREVLVSIQRTQELQMQLLQEVRIELRTRRTEK